MNEPFNRLTDAEAERLAILAEEAAEVIKCVTKILRHGYESVDPTGKEHGTNRQQLEVEAAHVGAQMSFMAANGDLSKYSIQGHQVIRFDKMERAGCYTHHQQGSA